MKLLLDSCIWPGAKEQIAEAGHEVEWVGDWSADPGDEEILARAVLGQQVVVTLDKDFGELAVAFGHEHAGIIRLVDVRYLDQATRCIELIANYGTELEHGAIVTAEPGHVRVRSGRGDSWSP